MTRILLPCLFASRSKSPTRLRADYTHSYLRTSDSARSTLYEQGQLPLTARNQLLDDLQFDLRVGLRGRGFRGLAERGSYSCGKDEKQHSAFHDGIILYGSHCASANRQKGFNGHTWAVLCGMYSCPAHQQQTSYGLYVCQQSRPVKIESRRKIKGKGPGSCHHGEENPTQNLRQ